MLQRQPAPSFVRLLANRDKASKGPQRGKARLLFAHPARLILPGLSFDVIPQLFIEILILAVAHEQRTQTQRNGVQPVLESHLSHLRQPQHAGNCRGETFPARGFLFKVPFTQPCERVKLRPAVVLGRLPLSPDPPLLFQLVKRRIKRSVTHLQYVTRNLFQSLAKSPAVERLEGKNLKNQQIQSALDEIRRLAHQLSSRLPREN